MEVLQAIILGIIQGLTEFLPISSSGHLILVPQLLGWAEQGLAFDIILHLGTLVAVVVVLRKDIKDLLRAFFSRQSSPERSVAWMIVVSTLPILVVGYFTQDVIGYVRTPVVVAISLIVWAIVLGVADWYSIKCRRGKACLAPTDKIRDLRWWQALVIGLAQVIALIPGTSRSGITITAGLFSGLSRKTAARWSFLLSVPAIAAAGGKSFLDLASGSVDINYPVLLAGFFAAMISGAFAIKLLLRLVGMMGYGVFVWYRLLLAAVMIVILSL